MYTVTVLDPVVKILEKMRDRKLRDRLKEAIDELADDPRPHGYKKLSGHDDLYRVRKGDWRIIYAIEDDHLVVLIIEVATRGNAYRNF